LPRSLRDIAWLGGLLEGEAAFTDSRGSVAIQLAMTDADTIARAAAILGVNVRAPWVRKDGHKTVHSCYVLGYKAIGWMMTLYQFLGERRQARIREIIAKWRASKYTPRVQQGPTPKSFCHPDRPRKGVRDGIPLCKSCWMRDYRHRTGKHTKYYRQRTVAA
jgi:hypothetical protein